jgi:hypothetical protein
MFGGHGAINGLTILLQGSDNSVFKAGQIAV